jgi:two-component system, NarL family, nitrate/nitrite response regulator NarL
VLTLGEHAAAYHLTRRETEVMRLVIGGLANKAIARLLVVEVCTVKFHMNGVLRKTKSSNRTEAACKLAGY